jgi:hypothetical protein
MFRPGREARWGYAHETVEAIEGWNCSRGRGCVHGAAPGSAEAAELGAGGTCSLLAAVFLQQPIGQMDDDGVRVTCRGFRERPVPARPVEPIPEGQLLMFEDGECAR